MSRPQPRSVDYVQGRDENVQIPMEDIEAQDPNRNGGDPFAPQNATIRPPAPKEPIKKKDWGWRDVFRRGGSITLAVLSVAGIVASVFSGMEDTDGMILRELSEVVLGIAIGIGASSINALSPAEAEGMNRETYKKIKHFLIKEDRNRMIRH